MWGTLSRNELMGRDTSNEKHSGILDYLQNLLRYFRTMRLNYNHLYYFWNVVRLGGVARAAEDLHLTPQTVSGQLKQFQAQFEAPLLVRAGRILRLSPLGEQVYEHADAMFAEQDALLNLMDKRAISSYRRLRIGAADVLPKITVRSLLEPALSLSPRPSLSVREVDLVDLLDDLAHRRLDAVIADRPIGSAAHARAESRLLLSTELAIYAARSLAKRLSAGFPGSLDGAPALLPAPESYARRLLEQWFHAHGLRPDVVAEIDDSALVKALGETGHGFFAAPAAQEAAITTQYRVRLLGRCQGVVERFYVITLAGGPLNPAVNAWLAALGVAE